MCHRHARCRTAHQQAFVIHRIRCLAPKESLTLVHQFQEDEPFHHELGQDPPPVKAQSAAYQYIWQVDGMDCPSCVRKIETALAQLEEVSSARIVFATQKLIVQSNSTQTQRIEQQVARLGFQLNALSEISTPTSGYAWFSKDNYPIFILAAAMALSAVVQIFSPQVGRLLFSLSCVWGLLPIIKNAWQLTKSGSPFSIETLMSTAAIGALYLGESAEAAMVLLLFLIGERLEGFAAYKARSGVQSLMKLVPDKAVLILDNQRQSVLTSQLKPNDVIEVAAGDRLPADGVLLTPYASFDQSALTGEPLPVACQQGDAVFAGAIVVDSVSQIRITSAQGESSIDRILHLIEEADSHKAPVERFLDKFSRWYTPLMMVLALMVILIPPVWFAQPWETWVYRGLALLLIACPCALVISTPAAITSGLAAAAKQGALIKGGAALEQLASVTHIAFDKTGTLTQGQPKVTDIVALSGWTQDQVLSWIAAIEQGSNHPLATSLVAKAQEKGIQIPQAQHRKTLVGRGVSGEVDGQNYAVFAPNHLPVAMPQAVQIQLNEWQSQGKTAVVAMQNDQLIGLIAWQDTLRADALKAMQQLQQLGINATMLTGDNAQSAAAMAQPLGIGFQAQLLPEDKVHYVKQLAQTERVAMVGDGINDAPAMKAAHIGIAMGGGTDVALETAQAALTHNQLTELAGMLGLARATMRNIKQNIGVALGLKALFLVTSLLGITGLWMAVLADSGATALVTLNALRLLKVKPHP